MKHNDTFDRAKLKVCSTCRVKFSAARVDTYCAPCRRLRYLALPAYHAKIAREHARRFPGVDIDAIHYKLGAVNTKRRVR